MKVGFNMTDSNGIYSNVGQKLKILAKIILVFGILLSVTLSIIMFVNSGNASSSYLFGDEMTSFYIILGIIFLFAGSFFSVLFSYMVYAFGAIAEKYLKEKIIYENRRNIVRINPNYANTKQHIYNDDNYDSQEITSDEISDLIGELNMLLVNGQITMDEFQRRYDEICEKNVSDCVAVKCPNCRADVKEGANFCTKCGTKIDI